MTRWQIPPDDSEGLVLPKVIVPNLCEVELGRAHITPYTRQRFPMAGGASFSDYAELAVLDHIVKNATFAAVTPYLGLWTSALADDSTSATAGELTYT